MHIMSDERYNRLMAMQACLEDPAPLPMRDEPGIGKRRIYDRIVEKCIPLMVRGESRRKAIASEKREKANRILEGEYGK